MNICESTFIEGLFNAINESILNHKFLPIMLNDQPVLQKAIKWVKSLNLIVKCTGITTHIMTKDKDTNFAFDWHRDGLHDYDCNASMFIYGGNLEKIDGGILEVENDNIPIKLSNTDDGGNASQLLDEPPPQKTLSFKPQQNLCVLISKNKAHRVTKISGSGYRQTIVLYFKIIE